MRVTMHSTEKIVELCPEVGVPGVPARVWEGMTESGVPVHVFVTRISPQTRDGHAMVAFESELKETSAPTPSVEGYALRMIL